MFLTARLGVGTHNFKSIVYIGRILCTGKCVMKSIVDIEKGNGGVFVVFGVGGFEVEVIEGYADVAVLFLDPFVILLLFLLVATFIKLFL